MNFQNKIKIFIFCLGSILSTNAYAMEEIENNPQSSISILEKNDSPSSQITDTVVMISPDHFEYNVETSLTNKFQNNVQELGTKQKALKEFNDMVKTLKGNGIRVLALNSKEDKTPDAVFPNNWFILLKDNKDVNLILCPMLNQARRLERQENNLIKLLSSNNIKIKKVFNLTHFEKSNKALEGTGSLILDRHNKIAYASLSQRTNEEVLENFSKIYKYRSIRFKSYDKKDNVIYHTNVMMSVGDEFSVLCADSIKNKKEKEDVINSLKSHKKEIIFISLDQVHSMCGNILQVKNTKGEKIIIMSTTAFNAFDKTQRETLSRFGKIVSVSIPTIEDVGGGSARCMLAEIFY